MIKHLCIILDTLSNDIMAHLLVPDTRVAVRSFYDGLTDPNNPMHKHAKDYVLLHISSITFNAEELEMGGNPWITSNINRDNQLLTTGTEALGFKGDK